MPAARLQITIDPSPKRLAQIIKSLGAEFKDWRPAWRAMLPSVAGMLEENLRTQGSSLGEKWAPLSPVRLAQKRGRGLPLEALIATHALERELGPAKSKRSLTKTKLSVGPKSRYPYVLHFGSKKSGLPPRRFIAWSPRGRNIANRIMQEHATRLMAAAQDKIARAGGR